MVGYSKDAVPATPAPGQIAQYPALRGLLPDAGIESKRVARGCVPVTWIR